MQLEMTRSMEGVISIKSERDKLREKKRNNIVMFKVSELSTNK